MAIKSALMTTAVRDVLDGDPITTTPATVIFKTRRGTRAVPDQRSSIPAWSTRAVSTDWLAVPVRLRPVMMPADTCDGARGGRALAGPERPQHAVDRESGSLDGTQTVTRTVTNVDDQAATYTASVTGLAGVDASVEPSTLTIAPGETASYSVTFTVGEETPVFDYLAGQLSWTDGSHTVRSPIVLRAKQPGDEDWSARYDGAGGQFGNSTDVGSEVLLHPDGHRVYMSGFARPPSAGGLVADFLTAAYDPETGDVIWEEQWDATGNGGGDEPTGFGMSPDGETLYVAGTSGGDYLTAAYDGATGERRWETRLDGPGQEGDSLNDLVVSPDGATVYVTGYQNMGGPQLDYATVAYDAATGAQRWVARYDDPVSGTDDARGIAVSEDGSTVVITGQSQGQSPGLTDWGTVAYDAATGEQLWDVPPERLRWHRRHHGERRRHRQHRDRRGWSGQHRPSERLGDRGVRPGDRRRALGGGLWRGAHGYAAVDRPEPRRQHGRGRRQRGRPDNMDYATVAYDVVSGEQRWAARYDGTAHGMDVAWDVTLTEDGTRAVVTGESGNVDTGWDYVTISAYNMSTGEQIWSAGYDAAGASDGANGVAVDQAADGSRRVFITGASTIPFGPAGIDSNIDAATVAYFDPFE